MGVFITSARRAYDKYILGGKSKVSSGDIIGQSLPLQCLLCCTLLRGETIDAFVKQYFEGAAEGGVGTAKDDQNDRRAENFHKEIPEYVVQMLETPDRVLDGLESKYDDALRDVKAIVVHDLRNSGPRDG